MTKGAFQISREIFENPIWNDIPKFRIFFYIVGQAVFSEEGIRKGNVLIKRGQYLRSFRNLQRDLEYIENRKVKQYSISVISRKVESLVKEERLKIEDTELGTLFTVVNYDLYQGLENYKNKQLGTELEQSRNSDGTELEQNRNNNKNVKNDKNVKEEIPYVEIINYLNEKADKNYKPTTKKTKELIQARWNDKFTLDDFKRVIDNKVISWKGTQWDDYLRPNTLFGTKFEGYLNERSDIKKKKELTKEDFDLNE